MTPSTSDAPDSSASTTVAALGRSRGWAIAFGAVTVVIGVLVMIWPGATVLAVAILFGIQLLVGGIFRLVTAISTSEAETSSRVLFAVIGILSIIAGILCLRAPFQTVAVLALILGLMWVVGGVVEIFHAFGPQVHGRGWAVTSGVVGVLAGVIVLVYPISSLLTLTWLFGILLVVLGVVTIVAALMAHRNAPT